MPVWVARTVLKWTVRGAPVCHDGNLVSVACHRMPLAAQCPATCLWESPRVTRGWVSWSAGLRWGLAAVSGLPRLLSCRAWELAARQALPGRVVRRSELFFRCIGWPSRRAPLAGASMLRLGHPGKLLLPGSCLLGPASSSCRGLVFLA